RPMIPCLAGERWVVATDQGVRPWQTDGVARNTTMSREFGETVDVVRTEAGVLVLAVGYPSGLVRILDKDSQIRQQWQLPGWTYLHALTLDPTGTRLACSWIADHRTEQFALFDVATGRQLVRFASSGGEIWTIAFSPDRRRLVTTGDDQMVRVWDP